MGGLPVAFVTGAGRGIGAAVATRLARAGYAVAVTDRTEQLAQDTAAELTAAGHDAAAHQLDVTDRDAVCSVVDEVVASRGRIDLVVNNAMWIRYAALEAITETDADRMLAVGIKGPLWVAQAVADPMRSAGGGSVVNIASLAAYLGTPNAAVYSAVKGGVVSLTQQLARDLGSDGIRVNAIAPGTIETPGARAAMTDTDRAYRLQRAPLGRLGSPEDVAEAVLYLGSPASGFVTGQVLRLDGGISASM